MSISAASASSRPATLVNACAIAAKSMIKGATYARVWAAIIGYYGGLAGRPLSVNKEVHESEAATNQRNLAIAELMYAYGQHQDRSDNVPKVLAAMATAGLFDDSGKWPFSTGLPAKSGAGGIITVTSPPLDAAGNSVRVKRNRRQLECARGNPYATEPR